MLRLPGMSETISRSAFEDELRGALAHLYDPAALRGSRLIGCLGLDDRPDAVSALRRILVEAIQALKPGEQAPAQSRSWRYYRILYGRYTEQLTQFDVANDMGLSVRQLRRQEKLALGVLADKLWARYGLEADDAPAEIAPGRESELAWSQTAFPSESVAVESLVGSALETIQPMIDSQNISVAFTASGSMPRLAVQLAPVRQAVLNVFTTALDWMTEGRLAVRAAHQTGDGYVTLSVSGYGSLAADAAELGAERLSVARELVEFSDGSLEVISDGDGDAAFVFRLTLLTDSQITVLAIDDNPDTLQLLERFTAGTRYRLLGESDAGRSMALAEETQPDIILLDVMLQDVDGWELLGRFRAHPQLGDRPVIVCTILPQRDLALSLGAAGFLSKPLSQRQLLAALDAQVDRLRG